MRIPLILVACVCAVTTVAVAQRPIGALDEPIGTILAMDVLEEGGETWRPVESLGLPSAGCRVNLLATNNGNTKIGISSRAVRTRAGWWKNQWFSYEWEKTVLPGASYQSVLFLELACSASRRYRFYLSKGTSNYVAYYPSATAFTSAVDIKLGDLNRFFK